MPFRNRRQMKACFAKNDPDWDCKEWAHETNMKKLKKQLGGPQAPRRGAGAMMGSFGDMNDIIDWTILSQGLFDPQKQEQFYSQNTPRFPKVPTQPSQEELAQGTPQVPEYNVPNDPLQSAIDKGLIMTPDGYGSAQEAYDFYNQSGNITQPRKRRGFNRTSAYARIQGLQNVAGYIGGAMERGRQNNYMARQFSTLGQLDAIPVENFQPNPFSLYAKYGGSIKKYMKGKKKC